MEQLSQTDFTSLATALWDSKGPEARRWLLDELQSLASDNMTAAPSTAPSGNQPDPGQGGGELLTTPMTGPGGAVVDVLLSLWPLMFLVLVTLVKWIQLPTKVSLPVAAIMLWLIRTMYFANPINYINALAVVGLFEAITPLSIIFGAILLFQTMHHTKCLPWLMGQIKSLSGGHPVAEVFLIAWSFAYLVEGASGFGTPVALASPMLAELGHDPVLTITCCLIMNALATQFGAVGTPIWFGFGGLGLTEKELQKIGLQAAVIVGVTAYVIPVLAAMLLVKAKVVLRNILFIFLSISSAVLPSIGISFFSYEFPSLLGGMVSLLLTGLLVKFKVGLKTEDHQRLTLDNDDFGDERDGSGVETNDDFDDLDKPLAKGGSSFMAKHATGGQGAEVLMGTNLQLMEGVGLVKMPPTASVNFQLTLDRPKKQMEDAAVGCDLDGTSQVTDRSKSAGGLTVSWRPRAGSITAMRVPSKSRRKGVEDIELASLTQEHQKHEVYLDELLEETAKPTRDGDMEISPLDPNIAIKPKLSILTAIGRLMPIWLTIVLLLVTRIPQLHVKGILQSTQPSACVQLGTVGRFCISSSVVLQIVRLFGEPVNWKYEFLYVPFFIPFTVVSIITIIFYFRSFDNGVRLYEPFKDAGARVAAAVIPNLGALILVQLIRQGGTMSPAFVIGYWMSNWMGVFFIMTSTFLGALGSFFSGSTTVSNLTFGDIQRVAAIAIHKPVTTMLAIQTAGATMGNMVCLSNVIAAKAVLNLSRMSEGVFIARTAPFGLLMGVIATAVGFGLMFIPFFSG